MPKVFGRTEVRINGVVQDTMKGAKLTLGGIKNSSIVTDARVHRVEEFTQATLECQIALTSEVSPETLQAIVDDTVFFFGDNGKRYIIPNMFVTDPPEITGGEGVFTLKMEGGPAKEIT